MKGTTQMAHTITTEIINAAIDGYEAQKARIDEKIAVLRAVLPGGSFQAAPPSAANTGRHKRISAAGRARIAEAQRQRWAALKGQSEVVAAAPEKPKGGLSAAGRKAIQEALRLRWQREERKPRIRNRH